MSASITTSDGITWMFAGDPRWTREQALGEEIKQLRQHLAELNEQAFVYAPVLSRTPDTCVLALGGQRIERKLGKWAAAAKVGMSAKLTADGKLLSFHPCPPGKGAVVEVVRVLGDVVEYTQGGNPGVTSCEEGSVEAGDRVILDPTAEVVVRNLGKGGTAAVHRAPTGVTWDDVGGQVEAKRLLIEAIEEPVRHRELYEKFGKKPCKGILLAGPPGTGKTMLGKACATALAAVHGASASESGFIHSKGPELLDMFVGNSEKKVRALFQSARAHKALHGYPAIVFLDEADGILSARGLSKWEGMERTIVPQFLAEMDGMEDSAALVLIATNRPDALDPALLRDGRVDRKIEVGRPSRGDCADIFAKCLRGRPCGAPGEVLGELASKALHDPRHVLGVVQEGKERTRVTLGDRASGALVSGIVERATQRAIRRALAGGHGEIVEQDLVDAVAESLAEEKFASTGVKGIAPSGNVSTGERGVVEELRPAAPR